MFKSLKYIWMMILSASLAFAQYTEAYDLWEVTPFYVINTSNTLAESLRHEDIDYLDSYALGVNFGKVLIRDPWGLPVDGIATTGLIWHNEAGFQDNFLQHTVLLKWSWKQFPWSFHLRTRFEIGTGASFTWKISEAEQKNRTVDGQYEGSRHLLNYNEFSLGFNVQDLIGLVNSEARDNESLDRLWLMMGITHRSGAWGLWGESTHPVTCERQGVEGAWNAYYIGLKKTF